MNMRAIPKNNFDRNWSSSYRGVPLGEALGLWSPMFNDDVKNANGNAPIPNDMWKFPSPKPNPGNV